MGLVRHNPFDLIGRDRRKYHSAIITCYTFDFSFFENRVMPIFNSLGIKNVLVFMDSHQLDKALEESTGKEWSRNKLYSPVPIESTGVFHPKILMLVGKTQGFLSIGSGNLTASGLSSNDEVWGAFQLTHFDSPNAPVFGAAWKYLNTFFNQVVGFDIQKLQWVSNYSPWLWELPTAQGAITIEEESFQVVYNAPDKSLLSQLLEVLPKDDTPELTIISPYFDKDGALIKTLVEALKPNRVSCLIDMTHGTLPTSLPEEQRNQISFYRWGDCMEDFEPEYNRLHAKLFHLKYQGEEYLLFGSPNATIQAFGRIDTRGANDECALLLRRAGTGNYLKELGIKLPAASAKVDISSIATKSISSESKSSIKFRLIGANLDGKELTLYAYQPFQDGFQLALFDKENQMLEVHPLPVEMKSAVLKIENEEEAFKLAIVKDGVPYSNYRLILRVSLHIKGNPDPDLERFNEAISDFEQGEGVQDLLSYNELNWIDEQKDEHKSTGARSYDKRQEYTSAATATYEVLDAESYNTLQNQVYQKHIPILEDHSIRIVEVLGYIGRGLEIEREEDLDDDPEQKLLGTVNTDGGGESSNEQKVRKPKGEGKRQKQAIHRYLRKLSDFSKVPFKDFFESSLVSVLKDQSPISIKTVANFLSGMQLINLYSHHNFEDGDSKQDYISHGALIDDATTQKGFLMHVLARFNMLCYRGFMAYEYAAVTDKMISLRSQLFYKGLFWVLNTFWKTEETIYRDILLLDLIFNARDVVSLESDHLQKKLEALHGEAHAINFNYYSQRDYLIESLLPKFNSWIETYDSSNRNPIISDVSGIRRGAILFTGTFGFYHVFKSRKGDSGWHMDITKPGLLFSKKDEIPLQENIQLGYKVLVFQ